MGISCIIDRKALLIDDSSGRRPNILRVASSSEVYSLGTFGGIANE
jgi:hypothetical protein